MTRWRQWCFWLALLVAPCAVAQQKAPEPFPIGYISLANDPRYAEFSGYANIVLRPAFDPFQGAETALQEGRVIGRALGVRFELARTEAEDAAAMVAAIRRQHEQGTRLFLLDAPGDRVAEVARATRDLGVTLFNVSAASDALRGEACQPHLLHVYPSRSMFADALAQYAASQRWRDVLVLQGPKPADATQVNAFRRAAERFGLNLVDVRQFSQSNDPRERARNNVALLTGGDYDLVYVADADAALGRYVPYRTRLPRPVIGDQGLRPAAWHWAYERHGAPQLNQRFQRVAERRMNSYDWGAWAAVKLIIDAATATRSTDPERLVDYLRGDKLTFDTYKGAPGSFRAWDNQFRQPMLLHTDNAVVARAPLEGFLHPTNYMDTLGRDRAESACSLADWAPPGFDSHRWRARQRGGHFFKPLGAASVPPESTVVPERGQNNGDSSSCDGYGHQRGTRSQPSVGGRAEG